MENSKLMQILVRDICEVEQLAEEIRQNQGYDALDIELLITRISGVRHLLEVAAGIKGQPREMIAKAEVPVSEKVASPAGTDLHTIHSQPPEKEIKGVNITKHKESGRVIQHEAGSEAAKVNPLIQNESRKPGISDVSAQDLGLEEEQTTPPEKQILGEKFVAGKSLNDLLLEKGFSDSKFASLPVSSLVSAIRTNDKFLFSRELFEGNMDNLNEAIRKIDDMQSIQDAATFLHDNFKWKKSETSLKFIDLVKRRFLS